MSDVQFQNEPEYVPRAVSASGSRKGIMDLVQKWGLAKNEKEAQVILLSTIILAGGIAIVISVLVLVPHTPPASPIIPGRTLETLPTP